MAVLDEFILQYSIKVKNAEALDQLQAKQKLFGNGAHQFVGDVSKNVNEVLDQLSKISPEAGKVLNFISQIRNNLNHLNLNKINSLGANTANAKQPLATHLNNSNQPLVIHVKNAVIHTQHAHETSTGKSSAKTLGLAKTASTAVEKGTSVIEAEAIGGEMMAGSVLSRAMGPLTVAAVALTTAFIVLRHFVNEYREQLEQQLELGNKIGLSTQQVEQQQRSLVSAGKGFLTTKDASNLMEKINTIGMASARSLNPLNPNTIALSMAKVNARDKHGDYKGADALINDLSDKLSKMTEDQAQALERALLVINLFIQRFKSNFNKLSYSFCFFFNSVFKLKIFDCLPHLRWQ